MMNRLDNDTLCFIVMNKAYTLYDRVDAKDELVRRLGVEGTANAMREFRLANAIPA
jgi:hypothetical protein